MPVTTLEYICRSRLLRSAGCAQPLPDDDDVAAADRVAQCNSDLGDGYGRLAEAVVSWFDLPVRYVLTDMIPVSLVGAVDYLTQALPGRSVKLVIDEPLPDDADVVVVPGWHEVFRSPGSLGADLVCNVESFQEMTAEQVGWWIGVSEHLLGGRGAFYCSNSRAYHNRHPWPIPEHWVTAFWSETPRAWTADHPTALYTVGVDDESVEAIRVAGESVRQAMWRGIGVSTAATDFVSPDH